MVLTDTSGADTASELLAKCLAEGDLAFFEDAVDELTMWLASVVGMKQGTYNRVELGSPLLRHCDGVG